MASKSTFIPAKAIHQKSQQNKRIPKDFDTQLPMAFRIYFAFSFHCLVILCVPKNIIVSLISIVRYKEKII